MLRLLGPNSSSFTLEPWSKLTYRCGKSNSYRIVFPGFPHGIPHGFPHGFPRGFHGFCTFFCMFPTCQVRVVRFYVSCLLLSSSPLLLLLLNRDPRRTVFSVGPQPRPSTPSVPCRTSTTTIPAQCSLPDLNHDHPRPVFPAGPQPRVSTPSVPCRTSCRKIWDKECAEES